MSWDALAWAIKQPLRAPDKLVLLLLAYRTNPDTDIADPSIEALAKECGMSRSGVKVVLQRLVSDGRVEIQHRRGDDGLNRPNLYRVAIGGVGHDVTGEGSRRDPGVGHDVTTRAGKSNLKAPLPGAALDFSAWPAIPAGQVRADWLALRRRKKAPCTPTAMAIMGKELIKAGASTAADVDHILGICIHKGWTGFEAAWLEKEKGPAVRQGPGNTTTRSRNDTGKQGGSNRDDNSATGRVFAAIRKRRAAAGDSAGLDLGGDDGDLRS